MKLDGVVLFSGGRDSTLVAADLLSAGKDVELLTFSTGLGFGPDLLKLRIEEMSNKYAGQAELRVRHQHVEGLVRQFALRSIEIDMLTDGVNLVHLGESLALLVAAARRCKEVGTSSIFAGYVAYQAHLPEQRPATIRWANEVLLDFGLSLSTPLDTVESEDLVKERLWMHNLSPKSLERSSMFADTHSVATDAAILAYLSRRSDLVRELIGATK